jgi:hypothetical protein
MVWGWRVIERIGVCKACHCVIGSSTMLVVVWIIHSVGGVMGMVARHGITGTGIVEGKGMVIVSI